MSSDEEAIAAAIAFRLNPVKWIGARRDRDTVETHVSDMEYSHIANCLRMIEDGRMARARPHGTNGLSNEQWREIFRNELIAREHMERQRERR